LRAAGRKPPSRGAGLFPVFDLLFGTFYMPPGEQPVDFGVRGDEVPETFLGQLVYPFRGSVVPVTSATSRNGGGRIADR